MRSMFSAVAAALVGAACAAQTPQQPAPPAATAVRCPDEPRPGHDPELAKRLGGDKYGMKSYVMALLKAGPKRDVPEDERQKIFRAHMANIDRLAEEGVLVLAGPFADNGELRGIYIFDVATVQEARALTATDPAIQAETLIMELHPWYGSAALQEVNAIHTRIASENP